MSTVVHEFFTLLQRDYNSQNSIDDFSDWLVETMDISGNGIIAKGEFKSYLGTMTLQCTESEVDQIWGKINMETSGYVGGDTNITEKNHLNNAELDNLEQKMEKYKELVDALNHAGAKENYDFPDALSNLGCNPAVFNSTVEGYVAELINMDGTDIAGQVASVINEAKAKATADCFIEFFSLKYVKNDLPEEYKEALGDEYSPMEDPIVAEILNKYLERAFSNGYADVDLSNICKDITNLITRYYGGQVEDNAWTGYITSENDGTNILNSAKGNTWTAIDKAIVIDKLKNAYAGNTNYEEYKSSFDTQFKVFIDEIAGTVSAEDIKSKSDNEIKDLFWKSNAYQPLGFLIQLNQGWGNSAFYIELFKALGIENDPDLKNAIIEASKDYKGEWKEIINAIKDRLASGEFKKVYKYPDETSGSWTAIDWTKLANEIKELIDAKGGMYAIDGLLEEGDMSYDKLWKKYEAEIDTIEYDKLLDPDNYKEEYIKIAMDLIEAIGGRIDNNKIMLEEIFNCNFDDIRTELEKMNIDEIQEKMNEVEKLITNGDFINPKDYEDAEVTWDIGGSYLTTDDDAYGKLQYVDTEESVDNQKKKQAYIDAINDFIDELRNCGDSCIGFIPGSYGGACIYANVLLDNIKKIKNIDNIDNMSLVELKNIYQEIKSAVSAYTSGFTLYATFDAYGNLTSAIDNANKLPDKEVLNNVYSLKLAPGQTFKMQLNASAKNVPEDVELTYEDDQGDWVSVVNGELVIDLTKDDAPKTGNRTIKIQTLCNGVEVGEPLVIKLDVGSKKEAPSENEVWSLYGGTVELTPSFEDNWGIAKSVAITKFKSRASAVQSGLIQAGYDSKMVNDATTTWINFYSACINAMTNDASEGRNTGENKNTTVTYTDADGNIQNYDLTYHRVRRNKLKNVSVDHDKIKNLDSGLGIASDCKGDNHNDTKIYLYPTKAVQKFLSFWK